mmetsp:Transcript_19484/g.74750  ORF Transcript_19484/g.74750 Transcript_19484/m.74750 type:complete len:321 (-) Transcript_19484:39-1001(-)
MSTVSQSPSTACSSWWSPSSSPSASSSRWPSSSPSSPSPSSPLSWQSSAAPSCSEVCACRASAAGPPALPPSSSSCSWLPSPPARADVASPSPSHGPVEAGAARPLEPAPTESGEAGEAGDGACPVALAASSRGTGDPLADPGRGRGDSASQGLPPSLPRLPEGLASWPEAPLLGWPSRLVGDASGPRAPARAVPDGTASSSTSSASSSSVSSADKSTAFANAEPMAALADPSSDTHASLIAPLGQRMPCGAVPPGKGAVWSPMRWTLRPQGAIGPQGRARRSSSNSSVVLRECSAHTRERRWATRPERAASSSSENTAA